MPTCDQDVLAPLAAARRHDPAPYAPPPSCSIYVGDARDCMAAMPAKIAQTCVTSPPYWGLRDYQIPPSTWADGWYGCLGNEPTAALYVEHIVEIFRSVRRVLRDDGTAWLVIGDSYASGKGTCYNPGGGTSTLTHASRKKAGAYPLNRGTKSALNAQGLKPKDRCLIPSRVAIALQADGWYIRSEVIWHKTNGMPASVKDRPVDGHETVWMLTKSERYYYDRVAVLRACSSGPSDIRKMRESRRRIGGLNLSLDDPLYASSARTNIGRKRSVGSADGRSLRSVWSLGTQGYRGAHFATFPMSIPDRCIRASTSAAGACAFCGSPFERVLITEAAAPASHHGNSLFLGKHAKPDRGSGSRKSIVGTAGWISGCGCPAAPPVPCVVIDPFVGSGTAAVAARRLSRSFAGCDASREYVVGIAVPRIIADAPALPAPLVVL